MRLLTLEDIRDIYLKTVQRGVSFMLSKFTLSEKNRTKSSFNETDIQAANWWIVPMVKRRWNFLITGYENTTYEQMLSQSYITKEERLMLSIGSGVCSHELELARLNPNLQIVCLDISDHLLCKASKIAEDEGLKNISFQVQDIYAYSFPEKHFDFVFFHSSMHHFKNLKVFIYKIQSTLKEQGRVIINEYVGPNRLQYSDRQLKGINDCIQLIPKEYRKIYKTELTKSRYYGSGVLRMIIADPSECVESESILPLMHQVFEPVLERGFGGNVLMPALKHIAHHFVDPDVEGLKVLEAIFAFEDQYLREHSSDFVFGIYKMRNAIIS